MVDAQPRTEGMHHVSALSAHIERSHAFYRRVLGLRPVIKTVNQDDPRMYHLFYGDGAGNVGSDMTVFDLPFAAPERRGNNSIVRTSFRVAGEAALAYWATRLDDFGFHHSDVVLEHGRHVLHFDDAEGTQLALVDDGRVGDASPWEESPVPADYQLRGLGYVTLCVPALEPTEQFLTQGLGLQHLAHYPSAEEPVREVHVYTNGMSGPQHEVHVQVRPDLERARYGAGGVHHLALRVADTQVLEAWAAHLTARGYSHSGIINRHYFTALYVREPNQVLFELAADGPGFTLDGPLDGERLSLPPFLEPRRTEIASRLVPLEE